jgi:hypothetical protein
VYVTISELRTLWLMQTMILFADCRTLIYIMIILGAILRCMR